MRQASCREGLHSVFKGLCMNWRLLSKSSAQGALYFVDFSFPTPQLQDVFGALDLVPSLTSRPLPSHIQAHGQWLGPHVPSKPV